jgi:hypothetical protein
MLEGESAAWQQKRCDCWSLNKPPTKMHEALPQICDNAKQWVPSGSRPSSLPNTDSPSLRVGRLRHQSSVSLWTNGLQSNSLSDPGHGKSRHSKSITAAGPVVWSVARPLWSQISGKRSHPLSGTMID